MAKHPRQKIREAVRNMLLSRTGAQTRVFKSRVLPYREELQLPAIAVYTREEPIAADSHNTAPRELKRELQLLIEAAVQVSENVDDVMDALDLEIENVMDTDESLGDTAADCVLTSTEMEIAERGTQPIGILTKHYLVTYYTRPADANTGPVADLEHVHVEYSLENQQAVADRAVDDVDVPTS